MPPALFVGVATTLKNFYAVATSAPSPGQSYTFTVRTGAAGSLADSAITCVISNTNTTCSDLTHSVAVTAGQMVTIKMVASGSAASVTGITFGLQAVTTSP